VEGEIVDGDTEGERERVQLRSKKGGGSQTGIDRRAPALLGPYCVTREPAPLAPFCPRGTPSVQVDP
jgi:hypothetical protein